MNISTLLALVAVWIAAIASPGPDLLQITRVGSRSRPAGVWCALGIMVGNTIWILASLAGLSALINAQPAILHLLQLVGGAFLMWMGYSSVRGGLATRRQPARIVGESAAGESTTSISTAVEMTAGQALRTGILTNLANPKAVLFFGAVFTQFIRPDMGLGASALVAVLLILIGVAWFVGVALAVGSLAKSLLRNSALLDIIAGIIFMLLAAFMIYEGVAGFL
ncbi:Threonine efflux protein [Corynebacterium occultum]|uniref:Threonine efflux protein n=1 Tax=Corynebacterium occultum TaxID=2675219 RepID=A0A6B8VL35_9CORY|nr:LysE family translocator [Corynebacterium occultum]QGU06152.1 Threonine efflux protein [Corynebacterium occultum]